MQPGVASFLGVGNGPKLTTAAHLAGVADLAAHLGIERRGVEDDGGLVLHADDFEDFGRRLQFVVADELGGRGGLDLGEFDDLLLLRGAGAGLLLVHQLVEAGDINGQAALAGHQLGEVEREAVGVVELKGNFVLRHWWRLSEVSHSAGSKLRALSHQVDCDLDGFVLCMSVSVAEFAISTCMPSTAVVSRF